MLLVFDISNTHTVAGVFEGRKLLVDWHITTDRLRTGDEYGMLVKGLFMDKGMSPGSVKAIIISSVVPPVMMAFEEMCRRHLGLDPLVVGPGMKTGMSIKSENPREVGADRIVNSVAGLELYGSPLIIADFSTATSIDAISEKREYLGGAITPGLGISAEALFARTAKLPRIELVKPRAAIGRNTVWSMQSGLIFGYASMVDGLIRRIRSEMTGDPLVVATGDYAPLLASECETISTVNPYLTLEGLRILYELNQARG